MSGADEPGEGPGDDARETGGPRRAPSWFAATVVSIGAVAAMVVVGRPVGLGVTVVAWVLVAAGALAVRRWDPWSVVWWIGACSLAPRSPTCSPR